MTTIESLFSPFILTLVLILTRFYCSRNILGMKEHQSDLPQTFVPHFLPPKSVNTPFSESQLCTTSPPHRPPPPPLSPHSYYLLSAYHMPILCYAGVTCVIESVLETMTCLCNFVSPGPSRSRHQDGINCARVLLGGNVCFKGIRKRAREVQEDHQTPSEGEWKIQLGPSVPECPIF